LVRGAAINLLLPFVNGLMLGFGELFANELAFRFGWSNTKVHHPVRVQIQVVTNSKPGLPHPQTSRTWSRDANRSCREEKTQWPRAGCLHELGIGTRYKRYTHHICLGYASQHGEASALFGHFLFLLHHLVCLCLPYPGFPDPRLPPEWDHVNMSESPSHINICTLDAVFDAALVLLNSCRRAQQHAYGSPGEVIDLLR
jgi:hypothetical protein